MMEWYGLGDSELLPLNGLESDMEGVLGERLGEYDPLVIEVNGRAFNLPGKAGEAVTLGDAAGVSVYADLDGDGRVDHVSSVHAEGGFDVWSTDCGRATAVEGAKITPESGQEKCGTDQLLEGWIHIDGGV